MNLVRPRRNVGDGRIDATITLGLVEEKNIGKDRIAEVPDRFQAILERILDIGSSSAIRIVVLWFVIFALLYRAGV